MGHVDESFQFSRLFRNFSGSRMGAWELNQKMGVFPLGWDGRNISRSGAQVVGSIYFIPTSCATHREMQMYPSGRTGFESGMMILYLGLSGVQE